MLVSHFHSKLNRNQLLETKGYPVGGEFEQQERHYLAGGEPRKGFHPDLSWSHYRALMRVENEHSRSFYELEAARNGWTIRQLDRQIHSFYYELLLKSRDKAGMMGLANQGEAAKQPVDVIKGSVCAGIPGPAGVAQTG